MQLWTIPPTQPEALVLDNTADAETVDWQDHPCIELMFPKFTDGRAYSQAHVLRRRGYAGDIRAVGDVLPDQLHAMRRCGFSSAVLRADQSLTTAQAVLSLALPAYQGDARQPLPLFLREPQR
jgi:uncharacterized protein (DUF934 family)